MKLVVWWFGVIFASRQVSHCHSLFHLSLNSKDREHDSPGSSLTKLGFLGSPYQCFITRCECTGYFSVLPLCPSCLISYYQAAWNDFSTCQPVLCRQSLGETPKLKWPRIGSLTQFGSVHLLLEGEPCQQGENSQTAYLKKHSWFCFLGFFPF